MTMDPESSEQLVVVRLEFDDIEYVHYSNWTYN